ncbi:hypothetical protein LHK18_03455 [Staphylococcus argenteus]|nr:hypothetical protein [Staphylococcus argenteus]
MRTHYVLSNYNKKTTFLNDDRNKNVMWTPIKNVVYQSHSAGCLNTYKVTLITR